MRKQVSFQDHKKENLPKFSGRLIWRYLESNFFIKLFITAIENIKFQIYLPFILIQTYIIFHFSRRLFAYCHTLSSWCWLFSRNSRPRKIGPLSIQSLLSIVVKMISILPETTFWQTSIQSQSGVKISSDKDKIIFRVTENVGMISKSRYTLNLLN